MASESSKPIMTSEYLTSKGRVLAVMLFTATLGYVVGSLFGYSSEGAMIGFASPLYITAIIAALRLSRAKRGWYDE